VERQWTISVWIRRKSIRFLLAKKSSSDVEKGSLDVSRNRVCGTRFAYLIAARFRSRDEVSSVGRLSRHMLTHNFGAGRDFLRV